MISRFLIKKGSAIQSRSEFDFLFIYCQYSAAFVLDVLENLNRNISYVLVVNSGHNMNDSLDSVMTINHMERVCNTIFFFRKLLLL